MQPIKLINSLPKYQQRLAKFINMRESDGVLSTIRIGQELATNLLPKSIFARGLVDLCDNAFREILETILVYLGPKFIGEKVFKKLYTTNLDKSLKASIVKPTVDLLDESHEKTENIKQLIPIKAALAVSALLIPLAEYSLSYAKNLFTLKPFKQADFNNIANLNKTKNETQENQKKVKESAEKHIKIAGGLFMGCLGFSALLLTKGKNSKISNHVSEAILAPGSKFFRNDKKLRPIIDRYFGLDFASKNGKLAMSNGQITACVTAGFFGYAGAAKDRGKQDYKEVLYRFPLVGFYAITGSDMLERGLKSILRKKESYKDLISEDLKVPKLSQLEGLAKEIALKKGTNIEAEFKRLFKQKSTIVMVPFLFGLGFMGFFVAGLSRAFTKYRYNKEMMN